VKNTRLKQRIKALDAIAFEAILGETKLKLRNRSSKAEMACDWSLGGALVGS